MTAELATATSSVDLRTADRRHLLRRAVTFPPLMIPLSVLLVIVLACVLAPLLSPYDPLAQDLLHVKELPSALHWLGTDALGRDVLSRLLFGGQTSLLGVVQALVVLLVVGLPLGLVAGYFGGIVDRAISVVVEIVMAIPSIVVIMAVLSVVSRSMLAAMVTFGILGSAGLIRIVRATTIAVRGELYVSAARVSGVRQGSIVFFHVLPRIAGPLIVQMSIFASIALAVQTGLAYLGFGIIVPAPSWGGSVAEAAQLLAANPFLLVPSGGIIAITIVCFAFIGDAFRDLTVSTWSASSGGQPSRSDLRRGGSRLVAAEAAQSGGDDGGALLSVSGLTIAFGEGDRATTVVEDVSFQLRRGEVVGLVGESGSGKTVTALTILGLLPASATIRAGSVRLDGVDLLRLRERELRQVRGSRIGLISQEPMLSLDPAFTVGNQLGEIIRRHDRGLDRRQVRARALELLEFVQMRNPADVLRRFPHELSGGMAQRCSIAAALAASPDVLIADEPTTALDVTVQAEILELIRSIQQRTGMGVIFVTHNLGVVADLCDRAVVMQRGRVVEQADILTLFAAPAEPYTRQLLSATPSLVEIPERTARA